MGRVPAGGPGENGLSWAPSRDRKEAVICSLEEGSRVSPGHILETTVRGKGFILSAVGEHQRGSHSDGIRCAFKMHTLPICLES